MITLGFCIVSAACAVLAFRRGNVKLGWFNLFASAFNLAIFMAGAAL